MSHDPSDRRWRSHYACIALLSLAACGGGGGDDPPAPANTAPVAAFSAAATVQADAPLAFDAAGSSDADGDTLSYHWDFGNGTRGGVTAGQGRGRQDLGRGRRHRRGGVCPRRPVGT